MQDTHIFPLRDSTFEKAPVKIPYRYRDLLAAEYGEKSLINRDFKGWVCFFCTHIVEESLEREREKERKS